MDIYRHKLLEMEYRGLYGNNTQENFSNIMTNLGFCSLDGSDVKTPDDQGGSQQPFKWKYDLSNNYYFSGSRHPYPTYNTAGLNFTYKNTTIIGGDLAGSNFINGCQPIIFIPLKNHGFIYEAYRYSGNRGDDFLQSQFKSLTPKFYTYKDQSSGSSYTFWVDYLIGIPDNTSTNGNFIYLFFGSQPTGHAFYKDGITYSYIPYVDTSANLDYVNKNANVCTLVPYPIENQFLDNLYLATTIPGDNIEGEFFSFGGRNFLGIYQNLVVELPAN